MALPLEDGVFHTPPPSPRRNARAAPATGTGGTVPPPDSAPSPGSLRGSHGTYRDESPNPRTERTWVEREIKVDLTSLGGPKSYVGWRWATETALGSSNVDMDLADQFIEDLNTLPISELANHDSC